MPGGVPNTNVPEVAPLSPLTDFGDKDEQLDVPEMAPLSPLTDFGDEDEQLDVPEVAPLSPLTDFGDKDEQLENGHPPRIDTCKTPFHQRLPSSHLRVLPTDMQIIKTIYCLRAPHNRRIPFPQRSNDQRKRWDQVARHHASCARRFITTSEFEQAVSLFVNLSQNKQSASPWQVDGTAFYPRRCKALKKRLFVCLRQLV